MGTTKGDKVLEIDYPLSFGNAFSRGLTTQKKKFRYLHLSGALTERDQEKALAFKAGMRRRKVMLPPHRLPLSGKILMLDRELRRQT
jgi:hypothetical protein